MAKTFLQCFFTLCLINLSCGLIFDGQTFRYSIKNILVEPMFFHTFTLSVRDANTTLLTYMEDTCDNMALFKNFSMTYFPKFGFYVSGINGVSEISGETYWELIEHSNGKQHQVGASKYVPKPGDHVAFNLTEIQPIDG